MEKLNGNIPTHWKRDTLENLTSYIIGGDWGKDSDYEDEAFDYAYCIRGSEIRNWEKEKGKTAALRKIKKSNIEKRELKNGDILVEISGGAPDQPVGRTVRIDKSAMSHNPNVPRICTNFLRLMRPKDSIDPGFLNHYLNLFYASGEIVKYQGGSNNLRNLKFPEYLKIAIPYPSLSEQQAIVSKIEELFSELDKGKEQLEIALERLKTYRQSLLKWAFEGRLTNKYVKDGELPEGWKWLKMNDICEKIGDIDHKMPKAISSGYPYVSTKDFTDDLKISFEHVKYISEDDFLSLGRKVKPKKGDIIFPRYGTIGKNVFVDFDKQFLVSYSCAILRPDRNLVLPKYLYHYSLSPMIIDEVRKYVVETTQANIGISSIRNFVFPLPSFPEQEEIVAQLEDRLSVVDNLGKSITRSIQQSELLRQSILKQAFEGKLTNKQ